MKYGTAEFCTNRIPTTHYSFFTKSGVLETNKHWNTDAYRRNTRVAVEHTVQLNSISRSRAQLNKEHTVPNKHTAVENRVTKLDLISEKMKFLKLYDFANLRVYIL